MKKPQVISTSVYNINNLPSSRRFEELMHRIFDKRKSNDLKQDFDLVQLMSGVGEKGVDILLISNSKNSGVIQCKMNTSNTISPAMIAKEIIKFSLFYYIDPELIYDLKSFKYYFACSGKFSTTGIRFITAFNNKIISDPNFKKWTVDTINNYKQLNHLDFEKVRSNIENTLTKLNIIPVSYSEINEWLHKYPDVSAEFFKTQSVVNNSTISKGIKEVLKVLNPDLEIKLIPIISSYYKSAENHLNTVKFIGHDTTYNRPRNITVSNLYVEPYLKVEPRSESNWEIVGNESESKNIKIHDILGRSKNHIILGDPGVGKSLMVKNIILTMLKQKEKTGGYKIYDKHIPFRIELRKYGEAKQKSDVGILSYLVSILKTEYQLANINVDIITYLIQSKSTLFIFDGLDEIFDVTQKSDISDDIVNFISVHSKAKCIVTSRFIGYQDISFPEDKFEEFSIQGFDNQQIMKFIERFYATQIQNLSERNQEIINCKNQIQLVDYALKSNPLILSLMSLLAINKVVIPDSKLEVYRSCTNTLVETRDKDEKQLKINLKVKSKRATFGSLAFWQYSQMTNKGKITRPLAKKCISEYLLVSESVSSVEAEDAADEFLKYAESRSIYFDDNFMHKTFLEYYAADYIFTRFHNGFKLDERNEIIKKYISNDAWHTVFELLAAMIDEQLVESSVMDNLLSPYLLSDNPEINYFLLTLLKSINNISDKIQYSIIRNCLCKLMEKASFKTDNEYGSWQENKLFNLFQHSIEIEHLIPIIKRVFSETEINLDNEKDEILFYVFNLELIRANITKEQTFYEFSNTDKIEELSKKDIIIFLHHHLRAKPRNKITSNIIAKEVELFGIESVFQDFRFVYSYTTSWIPMFNIFLNEYEFDSIKALEEDLLLLEKIGLGIDVIESFVSKSEYGWHFIESDNNKIELLVNILAESKQANTDKFISLILNTFDKKSLVSHMKKVPENTKFYDLVQTLKSNA